MTSLVSQTASALAARLRRGELSVETLARACLERATAREAEVHAWAYLDPELVLAEARKLDRDGPKGPLYGLPVGIKDIFLTKDMPTEHNSPIYLGSRPGIDAACVKILRAAGALLFGKTDTVEFGATGRRALTRNPHDLTRTPGGSSSGSAAAVADLHVPLALGTQTGGSLIRPASFCGIFAMKPTWNLVSSEGARSFAPTLDTIGWFGRSAADLALMYEVFDTEEAALPQFEADSIRIAVCRSPAWDQASESTREALARGASILRQAGADVRELDLPAEFSPLIDMHKLIMHAEARSTFLAEYRADRALLHESFVGFVENADRTTRKDLLSAYDMAASCRVLFDRLAEAYDAVLTPSVVGEAPLGLTDTGSLVFQRIWTLLHVPCINVPGFTGANGLPIGLTLVGPRFADRRVLAAAACFEGLLSA
jgi:Asp-tRNA(Asn)/Glu-tRNA(Gln) amidotransferase A subunit family amidase